MAIAGGEQVAGPGVAAGREAVAGSIEATEGQLRYTLALPESEHELWIRTSLAVVPTADAAAVASLLPAMAAAEALRVEAPIGEATLDSMREAQAVLRSWARSGAWLRALPFDREIALRCPVGEPRRRLTGGPVAAFFSGGVDSLSTVIRHPEITHLIHVIGFDTTSEQTALNAVVRERLGAAAAELGKELITVETNLREMSDRYVRWPVYYGSAMGAVALLLADRFSRVLIASGATYGALYENGSHPLLDRLWGADRVEVVHDGAALTRTEKLEQLAGDESARRALRVCWQNPEDSYNCCRCEKCLRTMVALGALGVRERFPTLPLDLDLDAVAAIRPENRPEADYWRENLALAVREQAAPALIAAIERCLASAEPEAQLAHRGRDRHRHTDPRLARPCLYMRPETRDVLEASRAIVFLIGGCDGWANFGDVAQLQATADLFSALDPSLAALPVIDPRAHAGWRDLGLRPAGGFDPGHPVYFAQPVDGLDHLIAELDLVPVGIPERIRAAATWLYGGGYLNHRWGRRKLLTARATEALCRRWGIEGHARLSSGLQIEPQWLRALDPELRELLARFLPLGVRDELSAEAAAALAGGPDPGATRTGDDAVGLLARLRPRDREPRPAGRLVINLHVCPGGWVSDDAPATLRYLERFVGALASTLGGPLSLQPLIAYDDATVLSERPALAELTAGIARGPGGVVVAEPALLSVDGLAGAAELIRRADLTVTCSYHVALTSLILEVPAALVRSGLYYGQKADGLRRDFSLPAALAPPLDGDPEADAGAVVRAAGLAAAAPRNAALAAGRERVIRRRARIESDLGAALGALLDSGDAGRRPPVVPVADYEALLAASRRAHEKASALGAHSAWQQTRLEDIEGSASWRLTGPLRSARRRLRRRRPPSRG